jgi:hypothetical protein
VSGAVCVRVGVGQVFEAVFLGTDYVMTYLPR